MKKFWAKVNRARCWQPFDGWELLLLAVGLLNFFIAFVVLTTMTNAFVPFMLSWSFACISSVRFIDGLLIKALLYSKTKK